MLDRVRSVEIATSVPANAKPRRVMEKLGMAPDPSDDFDRPRLPAKERIRRLRHAYWVTDPLKTRFYGEEKLAVFSTVKDCALESVTMMVTPVPSD